MKPAFLKCGFEDVTKSVNLNTGTGLKKGDVLLNIQRHTCIVIEDGGKRVNAGSNEFGGITGGKPGDQTGGEIAIKEYSNYIYGWDCVLRYTKDSGQETVQYTNFPKYTLSESAIRDIATMITGEQGGEDELACRQEASQLANLNEVYYGKGATETDILNSLHRGWYEKLSWSRGCTQTAIDAVRFVLIDAVRFVLIDGKRVLPRYVTEHDEFPNHIKNAKERNEYIKHQTQVSNYAGADYIFYCFFGTDQDKDIAGYLKSSYEKYKNDVPWSDTAEGITEEGETKITSSRVVSETGGRGEARPNPLEGQNTLGGACELYIINHDGKIMFPAVLGEITLEICRKGVPGKLLFSVLKSDELDFND